MGGPPARRSADAGAWLLAQRTTDLYLSVVSVGEVERSIARQRRRSPGFADALARWLDRVLTLYAGHILPVELGAAPGAPVSSPATAAGGHGPSVSRHPVRLQGGAVNRRLPEGPKVRPRPARTPALQGAA